MANSRLGGSTAAHLAEAFVQVARANHYMVGITHDFTPEERDQAEQRLIDRQNACDDEGEHAVLDFALDLIEQARKVVQS